MELLGADTVPVRSLNEYVRVVNSALMSRRTAATGRHDRSSRSHAIFKLTLRPSGGRLVLVDLAGSERASDREVVGGMPDEHKQRLAESIAINKSLSALQACVKAKSLGGTSVPFRQNLLTMLLRDSFHANSNAATLFIGCIHGALRDVEQTRGTLRFCSEGVRALEKERSTAQKLQRPQDWDKRKVAAFIQKVGNNEVPSSLFPFSGQQLVALSEDEFVSRCGGKEEVAMKLHNRLRELEAQGVVDTKAMSTGYNRATSDPNSGQKLGDRAAAVAQSVSTQTNKRRAQMKRHTKDLQQTKTHLVEEAERIFAEVEKLESFAGGGGSRLNLIQDLDNLRNMGNLQQTQPSSELRQAAPDPETDVDAYCAYGQNRVKALIAEQKKSRQRFREKAGRDR